MAVTVRQARILANKTQEEMAKLMKICRTTYAKLEANPEMMTIGYAKRIAGITGISVDELFFDGKSTNSR